MNKSAWQKRLSILRNRLYLYPEPESLPHTWMFWIATGIVAVLVVVFASYFIFYLTGRHDAYLSNAEDLGIMDQAIWNTIHGNPLHQTVCNIVHDTNCYGYQGISRFAIHFEPILFPVSLLYVIWADPRMLLVVQTLIVASGAFPAFWLARLRLRNEWAGVAIVALYLLYPAQQFAVVNDFHAVTFTASFLLFVLYFIYTRRPVGLFIFAILAMACKEEIPVIIAMFGIWSMIFQRRWRTGTALIALSVVWVGLWQLALHFYSPTGHSLLASRYTYLGNGPAELEIIKTVVLHPGMVIKGHLLDRTHLFYLRLLLTPAGYLPLLAPWVLILAAPSLLLNLLSSDPNQYSGMFQYNAEIVPILIFSTIEAIVLIIWIVQWLIDRLSAWQEQREEREQDGVAEGTKGTTKPGFSTSIPILHRWAHIGLLIVLLSYVLFQTVRADAATSLVPFGQGFQWPQQTAHTALAQHFIEMIPSNASVSAQSGLVPHISHRQNIYLFPYADDRSDYIFLDVTGDIYPSYNSFYYLTQVRKVLFSNNYGIVEARDGYMLLKRGLPPPGISPYSPAHDGDVTHELPNLPDSFCSYARVSPQQIPHSAQATFSSAAGGNNTMNLVGYNVAAANPFSRTAGYLQVTTYWKVTAPTAIPLQLVMFSVDKNGKETFFSSDVPAFSWCPTNMWKPGTIMEMKSWSVGIARPPLGPAHISIALLPLLHSYSTIMNVQDRLSVQVLNAPGIAGTVAPTSGTNGLQLATITLVP